jgi:tetratricopeptide (TPR) repeat protein
MLQGAVDQVSLPSPTTRQAGPAWRDVGLALAGLTLLVVGVFFPIVGFEFVDYDVPGQVVNNPHIRGLSFENLKHILTSRCVTSYYPVRTLTFALDYQLWELNAGGFKLTNGLIHLANVVLVFWLVLRLFTHPAAPFPSSSPRNDVRVAAFSAGIFAVHPVVVEPVAWVAGREELLMTLGALACVHLHFTARRLAEAGGAFRRVIIYHTLAALACAAACLSNAAGAVIPLIVTVWDLLTLGKPRIGKILAGTLALWGIAIATATIKLFNFTTEVVSGPRLFSAERWMLVLQVYFHNVRALVWPTDLAPSRSAFDPTSFLEPAVFLGGLAALATLVLLWKLRRRKMILFGLLWFLLALSPGSQVVISHVHRADRFLYLPLVGLVAAVAMSLRPLGNFVQRRVATFGLTATAVWGLLLLAMLSAAQVQIWGNSLTMWQHCVQVDPSNAFAHAALASNLAHRGLVDEAYRHRDIQLALDLNDPEAMSVAAYLAMQGTETRPPNYELAVQLARWSCQLSRWENPVYLRTLAMAYTHLAQSLVDDGQVRPAIEHYRTALEADPDCEPALFQLAVVLASCSNPQLRNPQEAVRLAERAFQLKRRSADPSPLIVLAMVYAEAWEFDKAITTIETAIELVERNGPAELKEELHRRLELYRKRIPPESLR